MTRRHASPAEIIENAGLHGMFPVGPVDYARVPTGPDTSRQVAAETARALEPAAGFT